MSDDVKWFKITMKIGIKKPENECVDILRYGVFMLQKHVMESCDEYLFADAGLFLIGDGGKELK